MPALEGALYTLLGDSSHSGCVLSSARDGEDNTDRSEGIPQADNVTAKSD